MHQRAAISFTRCLTFIDLILIFISLVIILSIAKNIKRANRNFGGFIVGIVLAGKCQDQPQTWQWGVFGKHQQWWVNSSTGRSISTVGVGQWPAWTEIAQQAITCACSKLFTARGDAPASATLRAAVDKNGLVLRYLFNRNIS